MDRPLPRWRRDPRNPLVKKRRITDGELLHLLVGARGVPADAQDERIYEALLSVKSNTAKALTAGIVASALAVLAYFGVLQRVSASGLEVSPVIFDHLALAALSLTSVAFAISYSKQTLLQAWFSWKFRRGDAGDRARFLLLYPEAYWYFAFQSSNIGCPPHVLARRTGWVQILFLLLLLVAIALYVAGFLFLWGALAVEVWHSTAVPKAVSVLTVAASAAAMIISALSPFHLDLPRSYTHYGLVELMGRRSGAALDEAHRRVAMAQIRMGLVDDSGADG